MAGMTSEERTESLKVAEGLTNLMIVAALDDMLEREKLVLDHSIGNDPEAREIIIHNITCLAAAMAKLSD